jgi:hypothetical protein
LAVLFDEVNVDRLLRRITARQFAEWRVALRQCMFGERRQDYRAAQMVAMLHNVNVKKEHQKSIEYFLLKFDGEPETRKRQSVKEQIMALNIMSMGG